MSRLRHLAPRVVRISLHTDFYLIVTPEHRANGAPPVLTWIDAYFKHRHEPYYLGGMSAASEHGASNQALQVTQIVVSKARPDLLVGRITLRFLSKKELQETPTIEAAGAANPVRVSSPEATALDLIRYERRIGGMDYVIETINELAPKMTTSGMKLSLRQRHDTSVLQRAGLIFDRLGMNSMSQLVRKRLEGLALKQIELRPSFPAKPRVKPNSWLVRGELQTAVTNARLRGRQKRATINPVGPFKDELSARRVLRDRLVYSLRPDAIWWFGSRVWGGSDAAFEFLVLLPEGRDEAAYRPSTVSDPVAAMGVVVHVVPCTWSDLRQDIDDARALVGRVLAKGLLIYKAESVRLLASSRQM